MTTPRLTRIAGDPACNRNDCPTIYTTDRGTIGVQGYTLEQPTPDGESIVEISESVLREAIRALGW